MNMHRETMTPEERTWAAIRLEKPDRVPVVPLLSPEPAAHLAGGITMAQVSTDSQVASRAFFKVFDEFGGWDSVITYPETPIQLQAVNGIPMKMRIPGKDLPEDYIYQLMEEPVLKPEDYSKICEMGIDKFYYDDYIWRITDLKPLDISRAIDELQSTWKRFRIELKKKGVKALFVASELHPFFRLSLMRSMVSFTQDLYYNPEPVEKTLKRLTAELIPKQIDIAKRSGMKTCFFTDERGSAFFYPPSVFERFWWPYTQEIVDAFWSEGIVTIFHLDQCWNKNLPYFRKLPKGSAVLCFDSTTDIFLAKEVLRGHLCLLGDVSASLLSLGKPQDVEAYCKKLIDEVGGDGGFILGSGCSVAAHCRPENFRALIETGKNYELSNRG